MSFRNLAPNRRGFLAGLGASAGLWALGPAAFAQAPLLRVATRQIEVNGKAATVFGVLGPHGGPGLLAREGDVFRGALFNATSDPLVMHWHGQIHAAAEQDRSREGGGDLAAGAADFHDFKLTAGTHWMHSHQLSEQQMLAAPMIAREKDAGDAQEVVLMLHDFAVRSPAEILAQLGGVGGHAGHGGAPAQAAGDAHAGHGAPAPAQSHAHAGHGMTHGDMTVHANDVVYDAYLANHRTLADPEIVRVERGGRVRLRIINGATAPVVFVDTGALPATCVAVDGSGCAPLQARRFPLAPGQRLDLVVQIPPGGGALPILAQIEAKRRRTGLILATPGAPVTRLEEAAEAPAPNADLSLDVALRAAAPLSPRPADRQFHVMLGEEPNYRWTLNGALKAEPFTVMTIPVEGAPTVFVDYPRGCGRGWRPQPDRETSSRVESNRGRSAIMPLAAGQRR